MATWIWVYIGSVNGLLPDGTKPLPEPISTNHQYGLVAITWGEYYMKCWKYLSLIGIWKLSIWDYSQGPMGEASTEMSPMIHTLFNDICLTHYSNGTMSAMGSLITGVSIVYLTVCSGRDQRKDQSSASLAFVKGIHRWPSQKASNTENVSIWWLIMLLVSSIQYWTRWRALKMANGIPRNLAALTVQHCVCQDTNTIEVTCPRVAYLENDFGDSVSGSCVAYLITKMQQGMPCV